MTNHTRLPLLSLLLTLAMVAACGGGGPTAMDACGLGCSIERTECIAKYGDAEPACGANFDACLSACSVCSDPKPERLPVGADRAYGLCQSACAATLDACANYYGGDSAECEKLREVCKTGCDVCAVPVDCGCAAPLVCVSGTCTLPIVR